MLRLFTGTDRVNTGLPIRVGLTGTGYAAKLRAEALNLDDRATLVGVAGHTPEKTQAFAQTHQTLAYDHWQDLVQQSALDLVIIAGVNAEHGAIAEAALLAGKHVVVEYPLAIEFQQAERLVALSAAQAKLLHVEHIELLGGVHQALKTVLPEVGKVFSARYATIAPQRPAPQRWTYHKTLFGFPLIAALSRLHRLVDVFGRVASINCQTRFWDHTGAETDYPYYATCLCHAQLRFANGVLAEVIYGKGEALWQAERNLEIQGDTGAILFKGDEGTLVQAHGSHPIAVGERRGLFAKDTAMVLDHLTTGAPLYVTTAASLYTLQVADAARKSSETGTTIWLES